MKSIKEQLKSLGITQVELARRLNVSKTTINFALKGEYPKEPTFKARFTRELKSLAISIPKQEEEQEVMPTEKQELTLQAQKKFNLPLELFGDIEDESQVYQNNNISLMREKLKETALKGKMAALVAQSGAGKSTLIDDLESSLLADGQRVTFIRPSSIGMAASEKKGNVLKVAHICDAVLIHFDPDATLATSYQKKTSILRSWLIEAYKSGNRFCIIVEEAHLLSVDCLNQLKSLNEIKVGFQRVLGVILVAQPEFNARMTAENHAVRQIVQRMLPLELEPIASVSEYILHICNAKDVSIESFIDESGLQAFEAYFLRTGESQAYPLAINNNMVKAINLAASMGCKVNKDVIKHL